jgi:hypothetical protein
LGGVNVIGRGVVGVIDWTDPRLAGLGWRRCLFFWGRGAFVCSGRRSLQCRSN